MKIEKEFCIDHRDTNDFASLSGDFNPLHIDPINARRLMYGETVVHGVHALLFALDAALADRSSPLALRRLSARFAAPIATGGNFTVNGGFVEDRLKLTVNTSTVKAQIITADFVGIGERGHYQTIAPFAAAGSSNLSFGEAMAVSGATKLALNDELARTIFPALHRIIPGSQLAATLAATRVVGMHCPGLNSLFTRLVLDFTETSGTADASDGILNYRVGHAAEHHSLLTVAVDGSGVSGELTALYRPPPVAQASFGAAREVVRDGEFAGQRALILGGSRGLGEVAAKLIAAGGGETLITYHRGGEDARAIVAEIRDGGGVCDAFAFDVLNPPHSLPDWRPSHLYYFATPLIKPAKGRDWDAGLFDQYRAYYKTGLTNAVEIILGAESAGDLTVIYPSTVFIDRPEPGMAEYAKAKEAGEIKCRSIAEADSRVRCFCPRLPRVLTDQTNAVVPLATDDSLTIMLEMLRRATLTAPG